MSNQHKYAVYFRVNPGEIGIGGTDIDFCCVMSKDEVDAVRDFKVKHPAAQVLDVYEVSSNIF